MLNIEQKMHPFDAATKLTEESGIYQGHTSEHYANMLGPFGGITAATLLKSVMDHPECQGEPTALTINYAVAISDGTFNIKANPTRTNRATQHWYIELYQNEKVIVTGTAVFANRRETWTATEAQFPNVPSAEKIPSIPAIDDLPAWVKSYDIKIIEGAPLAFTHPDKDEIDNSVTTQWIHDEPKRPIDFLSLASMCDAFFPRIYVRRNQLVPIGTVSLTIYFHADAKALKENSDKYLLGQARANQFQNGFFDQTAEMWTEDGKLIATTNQFVYFRK